MAIPSVPLSNRAPLKAHHSLSCTSLPDCGEGFFSQGACLCKYVGGKRKKTLHGCGGLLFRIDCPVGLCEPRYSLEVFGVIRDEDEIVRDGAGRYNQIEVV